MSGALRSSALPGVLSARCAAGLAAVVLSGCAAGPVTPARVDPANDQCASCRMVVSEPRFAAQVAAPGEEPRFYDDLLCLREGLRQGPPLPRGAVVFVADARTGAWVPAGRAVYARAPGLATPMASHWAAWADDDSRRLDPVGSDAQPVAAAEILGGLP